MKITQLLFGCGVLLTAVGVAAGPLYDPFLERFQVGTYDDPATIDLESGFPVGLFAAAHLDSVWIEAASQVLAGRADTPSLLHEFLTAYDRSDWLASARTALAELRDGEVPATVTPGFLRRERAVAGFFRALAVTDTVRARELARELGSGELSTSVPARERFVWNLRTRALAAISPAELRSSAAWPEMLDLGPFDAANAWTLWVAQRRDVDGAVLRLPEKSRQWRDHLAGLRQPWLRPADIYDAGLPAAWQAGLGASLLDKKDLDAHFRRFDQPPDHLMLQGHWVRGRRASRSGQAPYYEELAARTDLRPAWRLDVWRRASELRLLKGDWSEGLRDLEQALALSRAGRGNNSLRRRLRQWVEQALVLALAQNRPDTARRLHDMGLRGFSGDEKAAFVSETRHWNAALGIVGGPDADVAIDFEPRVARRVESGSAPAVTAATAFQRHAFLAAADRVRWPLWARWGAALVDTSAAAGPGRDAAAAYVRRLAAIAPTAVPRRAALAAIAPVLDVDELRAQKIVTQALAYDVMRLTDGGTPPRPSCVPELARHWRSSYLALHALLGFALATDDMRGTLAVAVLLPDGGLTAAEKRVFLYPLPGPGPIRKSLAAADNDPALLLAVARNESLFEPAVRSRAGALGWMQIMPFHYELRGAVPGPGNWSNPRVSIARGDRLLSEARRRYDGDPYRVLAAYNAGPGATDRWDRQLGGGAARDVYLAWIGYPETRHYVEKVLIDREIYTAIIGGADEAP